jgi:hypothetical protein
LIRIKGLKAIRLKAIRLFEFFVFFVVKYIWKELARRQSGGESISRVGNGL